MGATNRRTRRKTKLNCKRASYDFKCPFCQNIQLLFSARFWSRHSKSYKQNPPEKNFFKSGTVVNFSSCLFFSDIIFTYWHVDDALIINIFHFLNQCFYVLIQLFSFKRYYSKSWLWWWALVNYGLWKTIAPWDRVLRTLVLLLLCLDMDVLVHGVKIAKRRIQYLHSVRFYFKNNITTILNWIVMAH